MSTLETPVTPGGPAAVRPEPRGSTRRGELIACAAAALVLVALRSAVPLLWERVFDSDQAVVGLMAKHLSELRTFPLFFYGQNYMLGVQSWIAAPFFWIGGPTVAMLRLPLVAINGGVAVGLIVMLTRLGIRPLFSFVAVLPVAATTPIVSGALVEALGASIEPFAYVLLLWVVRRRPGWWGALYCVGYLHREFVLFAAPALLVAQLREGRLWRASDAARAAIAFVLVWILIDALKRTVNAYGPPGGEHVSSSLFHEPQQILMWLSLDVGPYLARIRQVLVRALPDMLGARPHALSTYGVFSTLGAGSAAAGVALAVALGVSVGRAAVLTARVARADRRDALMLYLATVALATLFAYGLNSGISPADAPVVRYLLFTLLLPVALLGWFFLREHIVALRSAVAVLVVVWACGNAVDTTRLLREYIESPPSDPHREVADFLVDRNIRFGRAGYWDAYIITFLSRERVILASTDKVRVSAYQALVDANTAHAVVLERQPCESATKVAAWCIERLK